MLNKTIKSVAEKYFNLGLNVTCINNYRNESNYFDTNLLKAPSHEWLNFQNQKQSEKQFESYDWNNSFGVGLVLGFNNIMAIDIDGCIHEDFIYWICNKLNIPCNYKWIIKSGSHAGYHIILICNNKPENTAKEKSNKNLLPLNEFGELEVNAYYPKYYSIEGMGAFSYDYLIINDFFNNSFRLSDLFQKIEFRWRNHLVLPPSIHKSGYNYEFINGFPKQNPIEIDFKALSMLQELVSQEKSHRSGYTYDFYNQTVGDENIDDNIAITKRSNPKFMIIDLSINKTLSLDDEDKILNEQDIRITKIAWLLVDDPWYTIKRESFKILQDNKIDNFQSESIQIEMQIEEVLKQFQKDLFLVSHIICHNYKLIIKILVSEMNKNGISTNELTKKKFTCTLDTQYMQSLDLYGKAPDRKINYFLDDLYEFVFNKRAISDNNPEYKCIMIKNIFRKKIIGDNIYNLEKFGYRL